MWEQEVSVSLSELAVGSWEQIECTGETVVPYQAMIDSYHPVMNMLATAAAWYNGIKFAKFSYPRCFLPLPAAL